MNTTYTYEEWKAEIISVCGEELGVHPEDMPDVSWRIWYDDGMAPHEAYEEAKEIWDEEFPLD